MQQSYDTQFANCSPARIDSHRMTSILGNYDAFLHLHTLRPRSIATLLPWHTFRIANRSRLCNKCTDRTHFRLLDCVLKLLCKSTDLEPGVKPNAEPGQQWRWLRKQYRNHYGSRFERRRAVISVVCGPYSELPHSADAWNPPKRASRMAHSLRRAKPIMYPVLLLGCGVMIANAAPPFVSKPLAMSPVVVFAPTISELKLEMRRDTLARMLTRKHVDSVTAREWAREFLVYGDQARVNPRLLVAIAYTESEFNPRARSAAGAIGLMQVVPARESWREYEPRCGRMSSTTLHEPRVNICFGAHIFGEFLSRHHGDADHALAAYNNGTGEMNTYPDRVYSSLAALRH